MAFLCTVRFLRIDERVKAFGSGREQPGFLEHVEQHALAPGAALESTTDAAGVPARLVARITATVLFHAFDTGFEDANTDTHDFTRLVVLVVSQERPSDGVRADIETEHEIRSLQYRHDSPLTSDVQKCDSAGSVPERRLPLTGLASHSKRHSSRKATLIERPLRPPSGGAFILWGEGRKRNLIRLHCSAF